MKEILEQLKGVTSDPYGSLADWKERNNRKIIGCFPMHLPEEIIHAAGMLPVVIWESTEAITLGQSHLKPYNCGLVRSFVDDAVVGRLHFLDGFVFYHTCLQAESLPYILEKNVQPAYSELVHLTPLVNSPGKAYLIQVLRQFKESLEQFTGEKITDQTMRESIAVYNKNRAMLRRLYDLRRRKPGLLKASEVLAIVRSSMLMPKEQHSQLLENLLPELESKPTALNGRFKVILVGHLCQAPKNEILDLIEERAVVVDDDLFTGSKYFANDVDASEGPLEGLAERFMKRSPPCPTKANFEVHWGDYIIDMVKRSGAQGVISLLVKYCPPHYCYYADFRQRLSKANIPQTLIETEHEVVSFEQVKTRLQAFSETIGGI